MVKCFLLILSLALFSCDKKEGLAPDESSFPPDTQMSVTPLNPSITTSNTIEFSVTGGAPTYNFTIISGGGTIVPSGNQAIYTPSNTPGSVVIEIKDSKGSLVTLTAVVYDALNISPAMISGIVNQTVQLLPTGGVPPLTYLVFSGLGAVDSVKGLFSASSSVGTTVVRVTDVFGNQFDQTIQISAAPTLAPVISSIVSQSTSEDTLRNINFTINDEDSILNCSTSVSATSSNMMLIPVSGIVFSGTAPNCVAQVSALPDENGLSNLVFTVSDGINSAQSAFSLTVNAVNDMPIVSVIANQSVKTDSSLAINFTASDVDHVLNCDSSVTVVSSNMTVLPNSNITKSGTAPNCLLTIAPTLNLAGTSNITVAVSDGITSTSRTFSVQIINVKSISLSPLNPTLAVGGILQAEATATYSDSTTAIVSQNSFASWSSSNVAIATVSNSGTKGLISGVSNGSVNTQINYKALSAALVTTVSSITSISVSAGIVSGGVGSQALVTATGQNSSSTFDITNSATWTSSNPNIATVNNGIINYISAGTAVITVSYAGRSAAVTVNVKNKTLVSLSVTATGGVSSVQINGTKKLIATAAYSDSSTEIVTSSVVWSTSSDVIITVSNAVPNNGRITGVAAGSATLTATLGAVQGSLLVNSIAVSLTSIAITPHDVLVTSNTSYNLRATGTYSDLSSADITDLVTWSSSNTTVATVNNNAGYKGVVSTLNFTGYRATTITAQMSSITGTTPFGVNGSTITGLIITPNLTVQTGSQYQMKAYANLSDGGVIDITDFAIWSASVSSVASISNSLGSKGLLSGITSGTSIISVNFNGISGSRSVTAGLSTTVIDIGIGLQGSYYVWSGGAPPLSPFLPANKRGSRIDSKINFAWGSGTAPMGVGDTFSVRWTGFYKAVSSTNYFCTNSDDGVRVWINGVQLINNWTEHGPTWDCTANIPLNIGTKYSVVMEFYENGGGSEAHLTRSSVSAADAQNLTTRAIPQADFTPN
jgi:trimeric autotransporter adhesin